MRSRKMISFILCTVMLLAIIGVVPAGAATPTVIYDGKEKVFTLEDVEGKDLFPEFKEMMPGDEVTQDITVRVENVQGPVTVYLTAGEAAQETPEVFQYMHMTVRADEKIVSEGNLGSPGELENGVELFTFDGPGEEQLEVTLKVGEEAGNELMDARAEVDWTFTVQDYSESDTVVIRAMDLTAYTGGDSISEDSFPTARYSVDTPEGVSLSDLTFYIDGTDAFRVGESENGLIQELEEEFIYQSEVNAAEASSNDAVAGNYTIQIEENGHLTAEADGVEYSVAYIPGMLTVRYVTDPQGVLDDTVDIAVPVAEDVADIKDIAGEDMAVGVVSGDSVMRTNGKAGIVGLTEEDTEGKISLLCDDILSLGTDVRDRKMQLTERAEEFLTGEQYSLEEREYEYRYLDLVNEHDGNAWVSSSEGVDVYYPYPEGTSYETADDVEFLILHFKDLHREYGFESGETIEELIADCEVETMDVEPTPDGLRFHVPESGFSPFAVTWQPADIAAAAAAAKTGDHSRTLLWAMLAVSSLVVISAAVTITVTAGRKKKERVKSN